MDICRRKAHTSCDLSNFNMDHRVEHCKSNVQNFNGTGCSWHSMPSKAPPHFLQPLSATSQRMIYDPSTIHGEEASWKPSSKSLSARPSGPQCSTTVGPVKTLIISNNASSVKQPKLTTLQPGGIFKAKSDTQSRVLPEGLQIGTPAA